MPVDMKARLSDILSPVKLRLIFIAGHISVSNNSSCKCQVLVSVPYSQIRPASF